MSSVRRPALRYHGGKWRLAPWIVGHFPPHRVYVEGFGGAASVLLHKSRAKAEIYNDLDGEIVNLFRVIREQGDELVRVVELTPFARVEFDLSYEPHSSPLEQARRTIVRSFQDFGGNFTKPTRAGRTERTGFRDCSTRSGTTPAADWRNYPENLVAVIERFRGVVIEARDAVAIMQKHDGAHTLHYVDPPYLASTRDAGVDYRHEMTEEQHSALLQALCGMEGMVVVSGYASALYEAALAGWHRIERKSFADGARARTEVLWLSPNLPFSPAFL